MTEVDIETGMPLNILDGQTVNYLKKHGLHYKTLSEILEAGPCPKVRQLIQNGIDSANLDVFSNAQKVQKFALLSRDFSIATKELTSTLKLKRHAISSIYEEVINSLYK